MATSFHRFHDSWNEQLSQLISQLDQQTSNDNNTSTRGQVDKIVSHYETYYQAKSDDVLTQFTAPWASSLERAVNWVTGFRPTTVFHLVYTESSIRFEGRAVDIMQGRRIGDMGELSSAQLSRVSSLQCDVVKEENKILEQFRSWQVGVGGGVESPWAGFGSDSSLEKLDRIVSEADQLRIRTIRGVVEVLTPRQAVEFVVALVELQFGIHEWGSYIDRVSTNGNDL